MASGNDDNANSKDAEVAEISTGKVLTMLDRLINLQHLLKEKRKTLISMKCKLVKIRVLNKKQKYINHYFMLE